MTFGIKTNYEHNEYAESFRYELESIILNSLSLYLIRDTIFCNESAIQPLFSKWEQTKCLSYMSILLEYKNCY